MVSVRWKSIILWLFLGLIATAIVLLPLPAGAAPNFDRTIRVEASSFAYEPATISINRGDRIILELASTDVVHGLYIDGYDLELISEPGQTARLTFVANRAGSFRMRCSVTCGDLHPFMIGKLRVGQNELLWRAGGLSIFAVLVTVMLYRQLVW